MPKYYNDEQMKEVRLALEDQIFAWPGVVQKRMFGCPGYRADDNLFAILTSGAVVLTKLPAADREELLRRPGASVFHVDNRTVKGWVTAPKRG